MFKVGNRVICINNSKALNLGLKIGELYTIRECYINNNRDYVSVVDDKNLLLRGIIPSRFESLKLRRKQKLNKLNSICTK